MSAKQLSIAITGAGGAGVISCGELLLQAWARQGGRGLLRKAYGPQLRGGESAALLKLTEHERYTAATLYDLVVALDWDNFSRFEDEIRFGPDSWVLCDEGEEIPEAVRNLQPRILQLPMAALAEAAHPEGRVNMLVLGLLGDLLGLPEETLCELAQQKLAGKAADYREAAAVSIGRGYAEPLEARLTADKKTVAPSNPSPRASQFSLTTREIEVLDRIAQGYTNNEIGQHLFSSIAIGCS